MPGPDEVVLVGDGGGLGAARVDHHQASAARAHRLRTTAEIGHRPHAAVAGHRVGAQHQQEVAVVDVGHRHRERVAVEPATGELARHLVQRGRAEHVARAGGAQQALHVQSETQPMHVRVAQRERERIAAMLGHQRWQPARDLGVGLVPGRLDEAAVALDQGLAQAIRVVLQVFQRHRLRAQVAVAEHVLLVAADGDDARLRPVPDTVRAQAAAGLAQRADALDHVRGRGDVGSGREGAGGGHGKGHGRSRSLFAERLCGVEARIRRRAR